MLGAVGILCEDGCVDFGLGVDPADVDLGGWPADVDFANLEEENAEMI